MQLFRLRELKALFAAYEIPWDPPSFTRGEFIHPDRACYAEVLKRLYSEGDVWERPTGAAHDLQHYFSILLSYREHVDRLLRFSSGVIEASGLHLLAHLVVRDFNQNVRNNVQILDDRLAQLISPEGTRFSEEDLRQRFAYPDIALYDIDTDFM